MVAPEANRPPDQVELNSSVVPMLDEILRSMLEERAAASMVEDELSLPVSRERFLTNPIHAR